MWSPRSRSRSRARARPCLRSGQRRCRAAGRAPVEDALDVRGVGAHVVGVRGPDGDAVEPGEERGGAVIGRRRAARERQLAAAREQDLDEHRGLRLDVQAHAEPTARERAFLRVLVAQRGEERHVRPRPRNALCSRVHRAIKDHEEARTVAMKNEEAPSRGLFISDQLVFRRGVSGRFARRRFCGALRESPTLARRFPVQVPGTHLYELVPPLPVLEVSNAGPPPFRG